MAGEWSYEQLETLRREWSDGKSGSEIAALLQTKTRNSVIGMARRLGLEKRENPVKRRTVPQRMADEERRQRHRIQQIQRRQMKRGTEAGHFPPAPKPKLKPAPTVDTPARVTGIYTLDEVQNLRGCLWPSGHTPNMRFCGNERNRNRPGDPYCRAHRAKATRPIGAP